MTMYSIRFLDLQRLHYTVNSEYFARVLFLRNFAYAKFRGNNTLAKWQNHSAVY